MKRAMMMKIVMMMMAAMVMETVLNIASTSCVCNWAHVLNGCQCPQLQPLKCTTVGCNKLVHQLCQNAFEQRDEHNKTTLLKCSLHHPNSPCIASKPSMSNVDEEQPVEICSSSSSSEDDLAADNAATPVSHQDLHGILPTGRDFAFRQRFGMLPTARNRTSKSTQRGVDTQFEYHHVFTTFACHKLPETLVD